MFSREKNVLTLNEEEYYKREFYREKRREHTGDTPGGSILDSSLIIQTKLKKYSVKSIQCGKFTQYYFYENEMIKSDSNLEKVSNYFYEKEKEKRKRIILHMFDEDDLYSKNENRVGEPTLKEIELKNINRSKFQMQRLVKSNLEEFKTFITLTFDDERNEIDTTNISECNQKFNIWKTYISKLMKKQKKEFKYVRVPEFQKRGAVHYHLLTNIDYTDFEILCQEERKIWNKTEKKWKIGRDVKGWKYGHNMAINMTNENIVGYLTKYMTKEIDNRLFGMRRYDYSRNLKKPSEYYTNFDDSTEVLYFLKSLNDKKLVFEREYFDKWGNLVRFYEYETVPSSEVNIISI